MKQGLTALKAGNFLNGQAHKQVTTIADCRSAHIAKLLYFIVNRSAIVKKKGLDNGLQSRNYSYGN